MKNAVPPFQSVFQGILQGLEWVVFLLVFVGLVFGFSPVLIQYPVFARFNFKIHFFARL